MDTPTEAASAAKNAAWAAVFCASVTLIMVVLTAFGVNLGPSLSRSPDALVDAAIFTGIALGLLKQSRVAAIAGVGVYLTEWAYSIGENGMSNPVVPILLTIAFVNGVRGTFSWQRQLPPPEQSAPDAMRAAGTPRRSYVVRHWRGELSLPLSYWINFSVLSWVIWMITTVFDGRTAELLVDHTSFAAGGMITWWVILYSTSSWQIVGLWRSASRRIRLTGKRGWARTAQAMCVGNVVVLAGMLVVTAIPQVAMLGSLAVGVDSLGGGEVKVIGKGREIEVSGPIGFGVTEKVRGRLRLYPHTRVIRLNSPGGRVAEARRLRELIAAHGMTTYSSYGCLSACTIAFLGGRSRVLNESADLGFHQYSAPGIWPWQLKDEYALDIRLMTSAGVDQAFAHRALTLRSDDMWRPTHEELLQSGYVTSISDGAEFSIVVDDPPGWTSWLADTLQEVRVYKVLAVHEPAAYADALAKIQRIVRDQGTMQEVQAALRQLLAASLRRHLKFCPDHAILSYTRQLVAQLEYLRRTAPETCYRYLFPPKGEHALPAFPSQLLKSELDAVAGCVEGGSTSPARMPSDEALSLALQKALRRVRSRYGEAMADVLTELQSPRVNHRMACFAMIALCKDLLSLPPQEGGSTLRGFLGSS